MSDKKVNMGCEVVPVELGARSYSIWVGSDMLRGLGAEFAERFGGKRALVITDANVGPLYAAVVQKSLDEAG